jgi:cytochrome P450
MPAPKRPPGPKGHFLIGNIWQLMRDPFGFPVRCAREFGDVVRFRIGTMSLYMLSHPEHIEYVLRGNHKNFIKDRGTRLLTSFLGEGLLTSEGDLWRRQRRLSQPAFQVDQVQKYTAVMADASQQMLAGWRPDETRDVHADMMRLTLEIVAQTLFSASAAGNADVVAAVMDVIMTHFAGFSVWFPWFERVPTPGNLRYRRAVRRLDAIIYDTIALRRAGKVGDDLLARLLAARDEDGSAMSDRQLRDELVTLFLAGHETTALALSYAFHLLAQQPEADRRLAAELDDVLHGRPPAGADVPRLRYTEWVVREAMRLYPPAPSIGREALAECEIGGYLLPKGAQIGLVQWIVHRDARWFDEPEAFRPERWDNDLARRLPRGAYFPFGDGPRVCIGSHFAMTEAVLILAAVAQRFRLENAPGFTLQLVPSVTLRPKHGVRMVVRERAAGGTTRSAPPVHAEPAIH